MEVVMYSPYPNMYHNPYQERLANMEQQAYPQVQSYQPAQTYQLKMIPVSNIEEANATPVDTLNGFPSFFYNKAQNEIYMKQFNSVSGGAIFQTYKLQLAENQAKPVDPYETQFMAINEKIDGLYSLLKSNNSDGGKNMQKKEGRIND